MNMINKNQALAKDEYKWDYNWDKRHPTAEWTDDEKATYRSVDFFLSKIAIYSVPSIAVGFT